MPEPTRIFAYGSLMNDASRRKTVPEATNSFPAKIYGFRRIFNLASHYRFCREKQSPVCVLNLEPGDRDSIVNGICFEMDGSSFAALIAREQIYQMQEITVHHYHDEGPQQSAFLFQAKDYKPFRYLQGSDAQRHYLNLCITGCQGKGARFLSEFKTTTAFWGIDSEEEIHRIWCGDY
ncbi:MAG: gamma-glutamylcyclotransferase family protein [Gammaproteobacteria bacterium]